MEATFEDHCTDDALELYALGRLEVSRTEALEEHLLICEPCRERLDETDIFVRAMKGAAARLRAERKAESFTARVARSFRLPAFPVWAVASVACVCLLAVSVERLRQPAPAGASIAVSLHAERGASQTVAAHHPLSLSLDARGLSLGKSAHVALVDAAGTALEQADVAPDNDQVQAHFSRPLDPGDYFIRICRPGDDDPIREFALRVQ
jgi:anti-sigma factor RsiW